MQEYEVATRRAPHRYRTRRSIAALALLATVSVVAACSSADDDAGPATTDVPTSTTSTTAAVTTTTAPDPDDPAFAEVRQRVGELVEEHELNGAGLLIVDRDDGLVFADYWGEFDAERVSFVASSSKMLTAGVLLHLQDEGLLDMDQPLVEYVDWATDNPTVTAAHLVSNSSGLVGLDDTLFAPYLCQFVGGDLTECGQAIFNTPDDDDRVIPPDTEFRYGGGQWQVAGAVAETVSGKSWAELIEEIYVEPCGVDSLGYTNHWAQTVTAGGFYPTDLDVTSLRPTANPHMEGGVYIDAPDYATLLLMHLREGECPGGRVLSPEATAQAHTDRSRRAEEAGEPHTGVAYGLGWWIDHENGRISDGGAYGSSPWLDLDDGFGAYLIIESNSAVGSVMSNALYDLVEEAVLSRR